MKLTELARSAGGYTFTGLEYKDGYLWGNNSGTNIIKMDPDTMAVVATISFPGTHGNYALAWDGARWWTCSQGGTGYWLNEDFSLITTFTTQGSGYEGAGQDYAYDSVNNVMWTIKAGLSERIYKLNKTTGAVITSFNSGFFFSLTWSQSDDGVGWLWNGEVVNPRIRKYDAVAGAIVDEKAIGSNIGVGPEAMAWKSDDLTQTILYLSYTPNSGAGAGTRSIVKYLVEHEDPATTDWRGKRQATTPKRRSQARITDGKLVVTGGYTVSNAASSPSYTGSPGGTMNDNQIFDLTDYTWSAGASMPGHRYEHAACVFNSTVENTTWDITNHVLYDVSDWYIDNPFPDDIMWKDDGTKFYVTNGFSNSIYQWDLAIPYTPSTKTYTGKMAGLPIGFSGAQFREDGLRLYAISDFNTSVTEYTLSTAWDITTLNPTPISSFSVVSQLSSPGDIVVNRAGTKFYVIGSSDIIFQYNMSTAWTLSTASYSGISFDVSSYVGNAMSLYIKPDGSKLYVYSYDENGGNANPLYQFSLPTPWSLSGATYDSVVATFATDLFSGGDISSDGNYFISIANNIGLEIYQFTGLTQIGVTTSAVQPFGNSFIVLPKPSGSQVGDLCIIFGNDYGNQPTTPPVGFTEIYDISASLSSTIYGRMQAWYKIITDASENQSVQASWSLTNPGNDRNLLMCMTWRGFDAENPISFTTGIENPFASTAASLVAPSVSGNGVAVNIFTAFANDGNNNPFSWTDPFHTDRQKSTLDANYIQSLVSSSRVVGSSGTKTASFTAAYTSYTANTASIMINAGTETTLTEDNTDLYYVFGGIDASGVKQDTTWAYDPVVDAWETRATMPQTMSGHTAVSDGTYIYVHGGNDLAGGNNNKLYRYDPSDDSWSTLSNSSTGKSYTYGMYYNGYLFFPNGRVSTGSVTHILTYYRIATDTWASATSGYFAEENIGYGLTSNGLGYPGDSTRIINLNVIPPTLSATAPSAIWSWSDGTGDTYTKDDGQYFWLIGGYPVGVDAGGYGDPADPTFSPGVPFVLKIQNRKAWVMGAINI